MEHIAAFPLPPVTLVLGGARSGKSTYAEKLVTGALFGASPRPAVYIATAEAGDVEMATRIMAHRARRGVGWTTIEEPLKLADALDGAQTHRLPVLVDCLTLWLSNLMHVGADLDEATDELLFAVGELRSPVIFVSNEVGLGIVPESTELSPIDPYADTTSHDGKPWSALDVVRPWDSLSPDEQRLFARMAEVYAGFLSHADHELGRLLDHLEESGELDNTI
ncbi:MAG: bifunctional adenosylcobinamide kinase/adenosylcobinamide-phosphate guanylyltransferase, partial [Reyranella sp.]